MFAMWVTGYGPETLYLGEGDPFTEDMKDATGVEYARAKFKEQNDGKPVEEWTEYKTQISFGLPGLIDAGTSAAGQFIGSYEIIITPRTEPDGEETVTIKNTTSMESFTRYVEEVGMDPLSSWDRDIYEPCGNMNQEYSWGEDMSPPSPDAGFLDYDMYDGDPYDMKWWLEGLAPWQILEWYY